MVYVLMKSQFGHTMSEGSRTHITNGGNVLIFGADMSFSIHRTNRANYIYMLWVMDLHKVFTILRYM